MLPLAAHLIVPPDPDWSAKKRLIRQRLAEVVAAGNEMYGRDDRLPQLTMDRLNGQHGEFSHDLQRVTLDLESIHDPEKFWHVVNETIPHEWAHRLNRAVNDKTGHGDEHDALLKALQQWQSTGPRSKSDGKPEKRPTPLAKR